MHRRVFLLNCLAWSFAGCQAPRPNRETSSRATLRVLTYNLHHGEGVDGRVDLARIAAVIQAAQPDLVALQEVDRKAKRTGHVDQPAEYTRLTNLHAWFGAAMPFQGGEYGQMLLSRWPLEEPQVVRLPGTDGREPRIAVTALVDIPALGRIRMAGLHLDASRDDEDRWKQAGALLEQFGTGATPCLVAGDYNATPDSRVMQRLLDSSTGWIDTSGAWAAPTIPAESPRSRIDYVLANPRHRWCPIESRVIPEPVASDHRPLLTVVRAEG